MKLYVIFAEIILVVKQILPIFHSLIDFTPFNSQTASGRVNWNSFDFDWPREREKETERGMERKRTE